MTHICINKITIIDSDNGLSPEWHQAIIGTSAGILLIGPWRTNFSEILIGILTFSSKKIYLKLWSATWCLFRLSLNVLTYDCLSCSNIFHPLTFSWLFHVVVSNGIIFLCAADKDFGRMQPFAFLNEVSYVCSSLVIIWIQFCHPDMIID